MIHRTSVFFNHCKNAKWGLNPLIYIFLYSYNIFRVSSEANEPIVMTLKIASRHNVGNMGYF